MNDLSTTKAKAEVVQPVYQHHAGTFGDLATAESLMPGDQTSILIAYECTQENLVPLGGLDIENPEDRVDYSHSLTDRMMKIEGLP